MKLICAAAILSAGTLPAFAVAGAAGPGPNQVMMLMSDGTMASMAMPTDPKMMKSMMKGAHHMTGCIVVMNTGAANRSGMYYMMATDKQCAAMSKG
jgi:hypothetical protein